MLEPATVPEPEKVTEPFPLLKIPLLVNVDPELKFIVFEFEKTSKVLPELIVKSPTVIELLNVTSLSIITLSPLAGITPPTQVEPVFQSPFCADVIVACAFAKFTINKNKAAMLSFFKNVE